MITRAGVRCAVAASVLLATGGSVTGQSYSVVGLANGSDAFAINRHGQITGQGDINGAHAFRWDPPGDEIDLGTLVGGLQSCGLAINSKGQVVGYANDFQGATHAFFWDPVAGMEDLDTLGGTTSVATGINDDGLVVGYTQLPDGSTHAFKWTADTGMVDLGVLPGDTSSQAFAVNAAGEVVGGGSALPVVWTNGAVAPLFNAGGSAYALNSSGVIVGTAGLGTGYLNAYVWSSSAGATGLGTLGGSTSTAYGVNDKGLVVGASSVRVGGTDGFIWDSVRGMRDVNALIPSGSGYSIAELNGVNAYGLAVGQGNVGAVLLVPNRLVSVSATPAVLAAGAKAVGTVTLSGAAQIDLAVALQSTNPGASVPTSVVVKMGTKSATFAVTADATSATATAPVRAVLGGVVKHVEVRVDALTKLSLKINPESVTGGSSATGKVLLPAAAGATGVTVTLVSSNTSVANPSVTSVTIPAGQRSATFTIATSTVTVTATVNITALAGSAKAHVKLTVAP